MALVVTPNCSARSSARARPCFLSATKMPRRPPLTASSDGTDVGMVRSLPTHGRLQSFSLPNSAVRRRTNTMRIDAGPVDELHKTGRLLTKIGTQPVCVLWDGQAAYAVDD